MYQIMFEPTLGCEAPVPRILDLASSDPRTPKPPSHADALYDRCRNRTFHGLTRVHLRGKLHLFISFLTSVSLNSAIHGCHKLPNFKPPVFLSLFPLNLFSPLPFTPQAIV